MERTQTRYDVSDRIATISLDRPEARNAFTVTMADELGALLREANTDPAVRVVILTATGKDFCVGADLSGGGLTGVPDPQDLTWVEPASRVARPVYEMDKPVIAAIRGAAVGAGATMVLPADFRIAATDSRFGFVFGRRGIYPEAGSTWFLPRLVGLGRATDWMVSGRLVPATEALAAGLVSELVEPDDVLPRARQLAEELMATTAPVSTAVIRRTLLAMSGQPTPDAAFALDSRLIATIYTSPDAAEGVLSFLERRPPDFPGRVPEDLPTFLPWRQD